ncbi:MAG TPA: lytic transglycosylase domain-containing protein, partial [Candidatus Dormibacteraeota bacterium]|nr:lytic transglycosylase domain-containing protein [Candidatus Dormibacteraeota bacterium]
VTGTVWDWVKEYVHPRFEAVTIDLARPLADLRDFLPTVLPDGGKAARRLIDSLRLVDATVTDAGIRLDLRFDVEEATLVEEPLSPGPEPTLSPDEVAAWNAAWEQWDAFVTFVAKNAAGDALEAQRQALFDVLIEARYDLLEALAPAHPGAPDPVRPLFIATWTRLAPVLRDVSLGLPGEGALRYLTFITAADALGAIDALGPSSGLDISADGLRRLARMIAPTAAGDPLTYDEAVDPVLRERFGFGPPPPPPSPNPDVDVSWIWPAAAWAADPAARLNHWVPTRDDLDQYLPLVRDLLNESADQTLDSKELKSEFHQVYRWLVLATAWKESCWRQFVRVNGRIRPMLSGAGAVGIMQVLPRVWRGFYEVGGLQQDIAYNARAGSEILVHYLRDYAVAKGEHTATGSVDNLARSTYAMYNGGPGQVRRYRSGGTKRSLRDIDAAFWDKYRKVKAGNELGVAECF